MMLQWKEEMAATSFPRRQTGGERPVCQTIDMTWARGDRPEREDED